MEVDYWTNGTNDTGRAVFCRAVCHEPSLGSAYLAFSGAPWRTPALYDAVPPPTRLGRLNMWICTLLLAVIVSSSPSTWTPRNGRSLSRVGRSRSDRCYGPNNKYGFCRSICAQD
ncbi:uncharacterized protein LOC143766062 isoform X1 [Ranitomeya variabilis]|uniref:uncharacterized protein LOC143766062 isoform X1 n=1 Tax=Ranitomeya variabilis TaxID=490064 RepID=UPI0040570CB6